MTAEAVRAAMELHPDALVVVGVDGVVRAANALACRLVRHPPHELVGARVIDVMRLEEPGGTDWWACSALSDADPALLPRIPEQRLLLHRPPAAPVHVTVTGRRLADAEGRADALSVALRRADRRIEQERRRSDLISTASHELRAPLTSVRGFTKTLLARWDRFDDATRRQMLATIDEDADRVTRLLTGLLDVSRIDTGRLPLRRQIVALAELVEPLAHRFAVEHTDRPLSVEVPADLPDVVIDRDRIGQVLTNLLENAVKHGAGAIRISAELDEGVVRCTVADEGGAIPGEELNRLFAKYYRIQDMRTTTGLGLGLYISRGIVTAHGGRIWADSTPEIGTRFMFTVPVVGDTLTP
ncbi:MAG TPA: ATP-binding protein [Euzebyales bacterium]|nr:ATP-binding protein [Euzebyales bacterium]